MKVTLIVLGCLLVLVLVLLAIRVGVLAEYADTGPLVRVWVGPVRLTLIPRAKKKPGAKKKTEKKKKEKKNKKQTENETEKQKKRGGSLPKLLDLLPLLLDALGDLCRRIRIDHLRVHYSIAGQPDPANAALWYGRLQVGGGAVCQLLEKKIEVRNRDVTVDVDFFTEEMAVYASAACSLQVAQIVAVALRFLWRYWRQNRQRTRAAQEG